MLTAVEIPLAEGVATKTHVLNMLHQLIDGKTTGPEAQAQALQQHKSGGIAARFAPATTLATGEHRAPSYCTTEPERLT